MKSLSPANAMMLLAVAVSLLVGAHSTCFIDTCGSHGTLVTWDSGCGCSCAPGWATNPGQAIATFQYCTEVTTAPAPPPPPPLGAGASPTSSRGR